MNEHRPPPLRFALAGAGLLLGIAASTEAQVIEIGPAGVTTVNGPAVVTADGAAPIVSPRPPSGSAARQIAAAPIISKAGADVELSPRLLEAIAYVESRFNQQAISPAGAIGVMQLMPGTAAELGVDPHNPEGNIRGGADYLRKMVTMFGNNVELAVAAYNAGPSAVIRHGGVPPYKETRAYVAAVMDYLARTSLPETE